MNERCGIGLLLAGTLTTGDKKNREKEAAFRCVQHMSEFSLWGG